MATKQELQEIVSVYKDQINFLKEQVADLRVEEETLQKQLFILQDGILNIRSPLAYADMRADEHGIPDVPEKEQLAAKERNKVIAEHLRNLEEPTFSSVEEMTDVLAREVFKEFDVTTPLHHNEES